MLLVVAIVAFAWAVRGGQFEDLETPALSILADDDEHRRRRPERNDDA